jgi:hypothetical protein
MRTGATVYLELAHRWAKGTAILFAVGAVSGTVLSFELGLLWPTFMEYAGPVLGVFLLARSDAPPLYENLARSAWTLPIQSATAAASTSSKLLFGGGLGLVGSLCSAVDFHFPEQQSTENETEYGRASARGQYAEFCRSKQARVRERELRDE